MWKSARLASRPTLQKKVKALKPEIYNADDDEDDNDKDSSDKDNDNGNDDNDSGDDDADEMMNLECLEQLDASG